MPGNRALEPYAVKAIIEHEFDVDHLNIWITFRFSMNTDVKPDNAKWICEVDSVVKAVTASAWQDFWTILLTVPDIAALPTRVTIEYDGPDQNLMTTWDKQWEPWAPILSKDNQPLPYGSFKGNEINWQQAAAQNVWYTISDPDITLNLENKMEFQNNQEFKILDNGIYAPIYYLTCECSIANKHVLTTFQINGTEQGMGMTHTEFGRANEEESWSAPGQFNLVVDDLISIGIMTPDTGTPTLTVDHVGLTLHKIDIT